MGVHRPSGLGLRIPQQLDYCTLPHCELASLYSHLLWLVKVICKTLSILIFDRIINSLCSHPRLLPLGLTGLNPMGASSLKPSCDLGTSDYINRSLAQIALLASSRTLFVHFVLELCHSVAE